MFINVKNNLNSFIVKKKTIYLKKFFYIVNITTFNITCHLLSTKIAFNKFCST